MIEKVARAMCIADRRNPDAIMTMDEVFRCWHLVLKSVQYRWWQAYVPQARAAIEAIREPSEKMLEVAEKFGVCEDWADASELFQAMIDAALGESNE